MSKRFKVFCSAWVVLFSLMSCAFAIGAPPAQPLWLTLPDVPSLPVAPQSDTIYVAGAKIWYASYGSGDPIVLLHGGLANANYFGHLVRQLKDKHRVVVIDSRGQGRSTVVEGPIHYHTMAEDVIAVLDHLDIRRARLIGWSDGGIIGLDLMIHHSERFTAFMSFGGTMSIEGSLNFGSTKMWEAYAAQTKAQYQRLNPHPEQWENTYERLGKMWAAEPAFTEAELQGIKVKTWIVDADHEEVVKRSETDRMYRLIPNANELILPGVSHFAMQQDPALFGNAVEQFLARTY